MLRDLVKISHEQASSGVEDTTTWDMISIGELTEDSMMRTLQDRFSRDLIYTYSGSILVSVNPYKLLPYYSADVMRSYRKQRPEELPPHLFAIAENAYRKLCSEAKNQSIIISGESGSGKTEAAKVIIQYLAFINSKHTWIEQQILEANPLLEAFGNAKTISNDNSSRFGKLVQIFFNKEGHICGAKIERYLLEKSRIVYQNPGERNYHIFYQLLAGSTLEERASLHLGKAEDYAYLNKNGCYEINGMNDEEEFDIVKKALTIMGIGDQSTDIFRILAAVLHLGNIFFDESNGNASIIKEEALQSLNYAAELLSIPSSLLQKLLLEREVTAGGDHVKIMLGVDEAVDSRDALAKALYDRLFKWLVDAINKSILPPHDQTGRYISILDIFGFESLQNNSFEQFCINYANERLQQEFINYVFKLEQEEYKKDELKWTYIDFKDNKECLDLIEKKPLGMLFLLDDECRLPEGTELNWIDKVLKNHAKNPHFSAVRTDSSSFVLNHYVGKVQYNSANFLEKSRDTFHVKFYEIEKESKDPFMSEILNPATRFRGQSNVLKRPNQATLGIKFKEQLDSLMELVHESSCHYLRCIRPNDKKVSGEFQEGMVFKQLQYSGMLSTIELRRAGYPVRLPFDSFLQRYKTIIPKSVRIDAKTPKESCRLLLLHIEGREGQYQLGKQMVFLKYSLHAYLDKILHLVRNSASKRIGRVYLKHRQVTISNQQKAAAKIQSAYRRRSRRISQTGSPLQDDEEQGKQEEEPVTPKKGTQDTHDVEPVTPKTAAADAILGSPSSIFSLERSIAVDEPIDEPKSPRTKDEPIGHPIAHPTAIKPQSPEKDKGSPMMSRRSMLTHGLPKVVTRMFEYLRTKGTDQVGIFRVAGAAAEVQAIMKSIEEGKDVAFHSVSDCNVVATVLKHYIRNMKEPIATYHLYDDFIKAADISDRGEMNTELRKTVARMPAFNRLFLQELCLFLSQVAEHSAINKMVPSNLAIVFSPNVFKSPTDNKGAELIRSQQGCIVMTAMIENYPIIFEGASSTSPRSAAKRPEADVTTYQYPEYAMLYFNIPSSSGLFRSRAGSVMDIIVHTKTQITQPMHKNLPLERKKDALETFRNILKFMGDLGSHIPPITLCQAIVDKGIRMFDLRDEILAQLCRQISNNRDSKSRTLGWQLLVHCLGCFPPSSVLSPYLRNLLLSTTEQPKASIEKKRAKIALEYMEKIIKSGPRKSNVSQMEFDAVAGDLDMTLEIRLCNNRSVKVQIGSVSQAQDICRSLSKSHPLKFSKYYGLYALVNSTNIDDPDLIDLPPDMYLLDFVMDLETKNKEQQSKKMLSFHLLYKQRIFTKEELHDHDYLPLLYVQLSKEYTEGRLMVQSQDIPYLSACELYRHHGDIQDAAIAKLDFGAYIPPFAWQGGRGSSWKPHVIDQLRQFRGASRQQCVHGFLSRISSSVFYGSAKFNIKYQTIGGKTMDCCMTVSISGLQILLKDSQSIHTSFPVSSLVEGVMQDEEHCEIYYEEDKEIKTLSFFCKEAGALIRLLNDCLDLLKLKSTKAVALFDYHVDDSKLLHFSRGDAITITERNNISGWYSGTCNGKEGWFPCDYIRVLISDEIIYTPQVQETAQEVVEETQEQYTPNLRASRVMDPKISVAASLQGRNISEFIPGLDACALAFDPLRTIIFSNKDKPMNETLKFTNTPIQSSITRLPLEHKAVALEIFTAIMRFMGDYLQDHDNYTIVDHICGWALSCPELRSEIFLQVVKQLTSNPRSESIVRGMLLLSIFVGVFVPDRDFSVCLRKYFKDATNCAQEAIRQLRNESEASDIQEINLLVISCGSRLRRTLANGCRLLPPPRMEYEAILERKKIIIRVELPDFTNVSLPVESASSAKDALDMLFKSVGLKESTGFSLHVRAGYLENCVSPSVSIMDLISTYERSPTLIHAGAFSFALKKRIYLPSDPALTDPTAIRFIFYQLAIQFSEGLIYADQNDIIALGAHYCVVAFGADICSDPAELSAIFSPRINQIIPHYFLAERSAEVVAMEIVRKCNVTSYGNTKDITVSAALAFITIIQRWGFYGSQIYMVSTMEADLPDTCLLAINNTGCHVLEIGQKQSIHSITFENLLNWAADDGQLSLAVGNLMQQRRYIFTADPAICSDMSDLISSYQEIRTKRRP